PQEGYLFEHLFVHRQFWEVPRAGPCRKLPVVCGVGEGSASPVPGIYAIDNSPVVLKRRRKIVENGRAGRLAPTTVNSSVRTREYLTTAEIERLMAAARKSSRYGDRNATMILIGYRHGLRASELCDLQWSQVELTTG